MKLRPILIHPDPRLKARCDTVTSIDGRLAETAQAMLKAMYEAPGIGLAAPQVGLTERFLVMDCAKEEDEEGRGSETIHSEFHWSILRARKTRELSSYLGAFRPNTSHRNS